MFIGNVRRKTFGGESPRRVTAKYGDTVTAPLRANDRPKVGPTERTIDRDKRSSVRSIERTAIERSLY